MGRTHLRLAALATTTAMAVGLAAVPASAARSVGPFPLKVQITWWRQATHRLTAELRTLNGLQGDPSRPYIPSVIAVDHGEYAAAVMILPKLKHQSAQHFRYQAFLNWLVDRLHHLGSYSDPSLLLAYQSGEQTYLESMWSVVVNQAHHRHIPLHRSPLPPLIICPGC